MEVADTFLSSFGGELLRSYYLPPGLKEVLLWMRWQME